MQSLKTLTLLRILKFLVWLLIGKVTIAIVLNYRDYLPANFDAEFLLGRQKYFFGCYSRAFYTHIASGPCSLIFGLSRFVKQ